MQGVLEMGMRNSNETGTVNVRTAPNALPSPEPDDLVLRSHHGGRKGGVISEWFEVWDYAGGTRFRGFISDRSWAKDVSRAMFVFFDSEVIGRDLRKGQVNLPSSPTNRIG